MIKYHFSCLSWYCSIYIVSNKLLSVSQTLLRRKFYQTLWITLLSWKSNESKSRGFVAIIVKPNSLLDGIEPNVCFRFIFSGYLSLWRHSNSRKDHLFETRFLLRKQTSRVSWVCIYWFVMDKETCVLKKKRIRAKVARSRVQPWEKRKYSSMQ